MAGQPEISNLALFCDFENIALGVRDAKYASFDIRLVLERLLLKGSIVVKKAYCDWDRYRASKRAMHEANFELIEIPHVRQSGKNSADIRMVVDALDLCYTKSHVDAFVIISGDSDFSPLVSKLRENNKHVIGIGVRDSTSDLLAANCDEFIFYDDLVREIKRTSARKSAAKSVATPAQSSDKTARSPAGATAAASRSAKTPAKSGDDDAATAAVAAPAKKTRSRRTTKKSEAAETPVTVVDDATADVPERNGNVAEDADRDGNVAESATRDGNVAEPADRDGNVADRPRQDASAGRTRRRRPDPRAGVRAEQRDERPRSDARDNAHDAPAGDEPAIEPDDDRRHEARELLVETIEALAIERGDDEKLWGSMVKQTMKRRRPGFNESSYGYKSFRELVDDAAQHNLLIVVKDERPGQYALRLPPT